MAGQTPVTYHREGGIAFIEIDNPPVNALSAAVRQGLAEAVARLADDDLSPQARAGIARLLREAGVTAEPAALDWLAARLGEDRMLLRREVEKLALYAGPGGRLNEEDVLACAGEGSTLDLDEALIAATAGDIPAADRALDAAFSEGASPVMVLRAALRQFPVRYTAPKAANFA